MTMWESSVLLSKRSSLPMHTDVWPMREVVTRDFRKSGSSTRAGARPFLIIASLQHSTNTLWVGVLVSTVCQLQRHGRFPSVLLPPATRSTGVSAQPPTKNRFRFATVLSLPVVVFPCDILHCTLHTETCSRKKLTQGKTPRHSKISYPCREWLELRCSSEDPYTPGL